MTDDLQFDQAEFADEQKPALPTHCAACSQPLVGHFWVEDRQFALCPPCKDVRSQAVPHTVKGTVGAVGLGFLAALLAGAAWGAVGAITGYNIGLVAIAAGAAVAIAVRAGAGRGGIPYQVLAALLTAFAIVFNETTSEVFAMLSTGDLSMGEALIMLVIGTPIVAVMLIPTTLQNGGFISLLIYGFALWQAVQMTAGGPRRMHEGPVSLDA